MYDANYYMEKLRKGGYVKITFSDGSTTVLHRGIVGYFVINLCYENAVVVARRSKRALLSMINWAVAKDLKIDTYTWHYVGRA